MDLGGHHFVYRVIDRSMPFDRGHLAETARHDRDVEMAAAVTGPRMAGVSGTIIFDGDAAGSEALQEERFDTLNTVHLGSFADSGPVVQPHRLPGCGCSVYAVL